jgi:PII-like signaling protein
MLRGIASFGPSHKPRSDVSLSLSEDPAVTIAAVDVEPKIRSLVDDVGAMTGRGLVTLERARLVTRRRALMRLQTSTATTGMPRNSPCM